MVLVRIITVGVIAIVITAIGAMSIGIAETVRYGIIGLAAAGLLLGFLWLSGRNSRGQDPAPGGGSTPDAKPKSEGTKKKG